MNDGGDGGEDGAGSADEPDAGAESTTSDGPTPAITRRETDSDDDLTPAITRRDPERAARDDPTPVITRRETGGGKAAESGRGADEGTAQAAGSANGEGPTDDGNPVAGTVSYAGDIEDAGGDPRPSGPVPEDVKQYDRFTKIDGGTYERANEFLRDRTYITAREWAIARLCADFRTETGVEMTKIGENLPELVPFMTDTYSPQAVNQARASFEEKVRKAGATFLYGAMCDFFTAEELDDVMYEATEVAKFLLEVEGVDLAVEEELEAEDRISGVMREVREHSVALRHDEVTCPDCGHRFAAESDD